MFKLFSVLLLSGCLLFLTGVNFFVYPPASSASQTQGTEQQDKNPSPVEEKAGSSSNNVSIQEEYLHERHSFKDFGRLEKLIHDRILEADKLQIVHYELISPPPKA
ncbi:MAG: hypothetical protein JWQ27_1552 [Ferruginibacter sp.]|nr:hypothetical protein [Ferruginibacter sp.]